MSQQCFEGLKKRKEEELMKGENVNWSCDCRVEMPIRMKKEGAGAEPPSTLIEEF